VSNQATSFRILVTGCSGFIGSILVPVLASKGHRVRAASRLPKAGANGDRVEWIELPDLETEVNWAPLLDEVDIVVHLAAIAHRTHVDAIGYTRANRMATASLAQACRQRDVKQLIFMSSIGAQTGSAADHVVTEKDEPWPITAYDRAKLAAEEEIRRADVPFTILRPVIVYGPGVKGNMALMMRIAALPLPLPFGGFKNRRSLLSIDNLVEAIVLCIDNPAAVNRTFIVSDLEPITLADMLATLREAAGRTPNLFSMPPLAVKALIVATGHEALWDRIGRDLVASSADLQEVGWLPKVETRAGLRAMVRASTVAGGIDE
jgi:nucleoside-diphosphate-sugar epimerase